MQARAAKDSGFFQYIICSFVKNMHLHPKKVPKNMHLFCMFFQTSSDALTSYLYFFVFLIYYNSTCYKSISIFRFQLVHPYGMLFSYVLLFTERSSLTGCNTIHNHFNTSILCIHSSPFCFPVREKRSVEDYQMASRHPIGMYQIAHQ